MNEITRKAIAALADAIEADETVVTYKLAREAYSRDPELATKVNEYSVQRMVYEQEASKEEKDEKLLSDIDARMKVLYEEVMNNPVMLALAKAENELNELLNELNSTLRSRIMPESEHVCGGDCSACGDCH